MAVLLYLFFELPYRVAFYEFNNDVEYKKEMPITITIDRIVDVILFVE
jgi:hypothetical protein